MMGLATDGGLLLPETLPKVDGLTISSWHNLNYQQLAYEVLSLFITDIPATDLRSLISNSYASFTHPEITPLVKFADCYILELFHGPTLAFKDVALQFLGNVFEYLLQESGGRLNILGATSGDTGSAAIYGVRGKKRINIFMLHPHKRVSPVQELQMTTVTDGNVFNLAIKGTFDDGQAIVKNIFNDLAFKKKYHLGAVNSINWARIIAQVVYYVYAALKATKDTGCKYVDFSVPTGNFGDIFAGFIARHLLPAYIRHLVLATNENNLLTRFVLEGDYSIGRVVETSSPSMDIQVSSNFERYLYYLYDCEQHRVNQAMAEFTKSGRLCFDGPLKEQISSDFHSKSVDEQTTVDTIRRFYQEHGYVLDPHTAIGVNSGLAFADDTTPMICLATAHPAKFGDTVCKAIGHFPDMPASLHNLQAQKTRCELLPAEVDAVRLFLRRNS